MLSLCKKFRQKFNMVLEGVEHVGFFGLMAFFVEARNLPASSTPDDSEIMEIIS